MAVCKTMNEYIETHLYNFPYGTRFSVLEHLFCTLGNGVWFNYDGYIANDFISPYDDEDGNKIYKKHYEHEVWVSGINPRRKVSESTILERTQNEVLESMKYKEKSRKLPKFLVVYPWTETESLQPFRNFENSRMEGLKEEVLYFIDILENHKQTFQDFLEFYKNYTCCSFADIKSYEKMMEKYNEYQKDFQDWKDNIPVLKEFFEV